MMANLTTLEDAVTGIFEVVTVSGSTYFIDLDTPTLTRVVIVPSGAVPAPATGKDINYGEYREDQSILRGDNETLELVAVQSCTVGRGAVFAVSGLAHDPNVVTLRFTSTVVSIREVVGDYSG